MVKTLPEPLSKEEINSIIEASINDDFYYLFFNVAKSTGRRLGEYWNVKVKDIDFERKVMMTLVLKRRKRIEKEAILTDDIVLLMKRYISKHKLTLDSYIFRGDYKSESYRQIQNMVKVYAKKGGVKKNVSFHNFRHYFITALVKQGWSYDKIAKLTGHSSVGTLATYDHAVASDIKEDALEALKDI